MQSPTKLRMASSVLFAILFLFLAFDSFRANAEPFAYVVNTGDSTVSVIDTATDSVVGQPIPLTPTGMGRNWSVLSPDGLRLYVLDFIGTSIAVIDTLTNTQIESIGGFENPSGMAITPDGTKAYVGERGDPELPDLNRVAVLDLSSKTITKRIGVFAPSTGGIAITPDGTKTFVAAFPAQPLPSGSWGVTVIDVDTDAVTNEVILPIRSRSRGLTILPNGSKAYVAIQDSNAVAVIDISTQTVSKILSGFNAPASVAATPDSATVYVTNQGPVGDGTTVTVIDTNTDTVSTTIGGFNQPQHIAITPDGAKVYVGELSSATVAVFDTATNTFAGTRVPVGAVPRGIVIGGPISPSVVGVAINIKPGSDPNSINTCSGGTTPVTIFGSPDLDVVTIDPTSLILASATVKLVGKSDRILCGIEDIGKVDITFFDDLDPTADGEPDLTCHFVTIALTDLVDSSTSADLTGNGCDSATPLPDCSVSPSNFFELAGSDSVNVVKDCS